MEQTESQKPPEAPEEIKEYKDGFGWMAVLGGLFVGFLIVPGDMFMGLMVGESLGGVSQWVTLILFLEIAKRCRRELGKQEIFILFAFTGTILGQGGIGSFIWMQFFVQSPAAEMFEIGDRIPLWVAPPPGSDAYALRSLLHHDWWPHLTLMATFIVWGQLNFYSLGYALFRITSDVERLPFPMAPINAQGITALAESEKQTWRWRCFTIGAAIGLAYGAVYIGVPTVTGVVFDRELTIIPIPFKDFTVNFEKILPSVPVAIGTNIGIIFIGFVLPFWMVAGSFFAAVLGQLILNPILHHTGVLTTWKPGMDVIDTGQANTLDFWLSFGIGTAIGTALIGFWSVGRSLRKSWKERRSEGGDRKFIPAPLGRGDIPILMALLFYVVSTTGTIIICHYLVPKFPIWILLFFGFVYTPMVSYVSARMVGLTGHGTGFPLVKESSILLTGYKGVDIWNAPIPIGDAGGSAQWFRECELTGTKFSSVFKAQVIAIPLAVFVGILFWSLIWKMGEIPSSSYPNAVKFWPPRAFNGCLWWTASTTGNDFFMSVIKPLFIFWGVVYVLVTFPLLAFFKLPELFLWGTVRGLAGNAIGFIPEFGAALLGRYYFAKKFGEKAWSQYTPILAAGYGCGLGLIGMTGIAFKLIKSAITQLPF
ncbi:MAG: peptide transporter [Planctomycetes bacterium]|nr:peptide transporter [Planctomycetota bacterium]